MNNSQPENQNSDYSTSSNSPDEIVSIIPQSSETHHLDSFNEEAYAIYESSRPSYIQDKPLWLDTLLTPWGFGSILLVLLSNSLLSWATLSNSYARQTTPPVENPKAQSTPTASASVPQVPVPSVVSPTMAVPPQLMKSSTPPPPPQIVNIPHPPAKPVATVKPKTDLTSALLPPSAKPQFVQVKTIQSSTPTVSAKTVSTGVKKATLPTQKASLPAVAQITTLPPPPTTKPAEIQITTSNADHSKIRIANERFLEEARLREEAKPNLTFFQKTKVQKQVLQTRQNLNQALDKLEQPQQFQSASQPQATQPPAIPNTLIIDGNNPENNTNQ